MKKSLVDLQVGDTVWYKGQTGIYPARVAIVARVSERFAPNWVQIEWLDIEGGLMVFTVERDLLLEDPNPEPVQPESEQAHLLEPFHPEVPVDADLSSAPSRPVAVSVETFVATDVEVTVEQADEARDRGAHESEPFDAAAFVNGLTPEQRQQIFSQMMPHFALSNALGRGKKKMAG